MFVDSDDFINGEVDMNELLNSLDGTDIIQYKMVYYYEKADKYVYLKALNDGINDKSIVDQTSYKIKNDEFSVQACSKIVKRELLIQHDVFFEKGILSEDIDWSLKLYLHVKTMKTLNLDLYVYRQARKGSISNTKSHKSIESLLSIIQKWANYDYESEETKTCYYNYIAYQYVILLSLMNKNNSTKEEREEVSKMKYLLQYDSCKKVHMSKTLFSLVGTKIGVKILKLYIKLKDSGLIKL